MGGRQSSGTFAQAINNASQVVGYFNGTDGIHSFLYSGGTYTTLDDPLGVRGTYATGINNFGQIVGYFIDVNGGIHGFIDAGGIYTTIDNPSAVGGTYVYGINNLGPAIGMAFLPICLYPARRHNRRYDPAACRRR
ncbi:MAG: hypothetical protein E6G76_24775 [Alphaproteobacteria bacterium]|nr:MAG: hypothetical protein E6G76_24775 [Alphaproteobacteria bacterium]